MSHGIAWYSILVFEKILRMRGNEYGIRLIRSTAIGNDASLTGILCDRRVLSCSTGGVETVLQAVVDKLSVKTTVTKHASISLLIWEFVRRRYLGERSVCG